MEVKLKDTERIDDLQLKGLKVIQDKNGFCFGIDAVLLANFAKVKKRARVVDLGTGTGIIPVLIAGKSEAEKIVGVEIQEEVWEMANRTVKLNDLQDRLDAALSELNNAEVDSSLKEDLEEIRNKYEKLKERYNDIIDENNGLNTKVVELENQLSDIVPDNENIMQIQHLNSVVEKLKASKDRVENEKLEIELRLDTLTKEINLLKGNVEEYKEENANLALQLEEAREANNQHAEGDEDFENRIKELADKLGAKEIELIEANTTIRNLESEVNKKKRELLMIPDSSSIIKKLEEALDMVSKENRALVEENINLLATNKSLESKIAQTETVNNNLEVLIEGYKRRLDLGERPVVAPVVEEPVEEPVVEVADVAQVHDKDEILEDIIEEPVEEPVRTYDDSEMVRIFALGMEYRVLAQKLKPEFKTKHSEVGLLILENIDKIHDFDSNKDFLLSLIKDRLDNENNFSK